MATRVHYRLVDDLDRTTEGVRRHRLVLDGVEYEIDLSSDNLDRLRAALAPFIAAGRRLPRTISRRNGGSGDAAAIRRWWASHQHPTLPAYRDHGGIPRRVRDAYHAAHQTR